MARNRESRREEKKPLAAGLSQILESSLNTFCPACHLEMNSNKEATVEGCRGILEYTTQVVRLSADRMVIRFTGRDLELLSMNASAVVVRGTIAAVEFTM